jgi:hypothetical protein
VCFLQVDDWRVDVSTHVERGMKRGKSREKKKGAVVCSDALIVSMVGKQVTRGRNKGGVEV